MPTSNFALRSWRTMSKLPLGSKAFSRVVATRAPYFMTISPHITTLEPGRCTVEMKKRWIVTNHLGTVHAIAMCNLAEVAGGLMAEVTTPSTHRWIPKGMTVEYRKKAATDLRAECHCDPLPDFGPEPFEWPVTVDVFDREGQNVFGATITMWISPRRADA